MQSLDRKPEYLRRPASSAGFYGDEFHRSDFLSQDHQRPASQLYSSRQSNASFDSTQHDVSPKTKLMLYLGPKRLSSPVVKPTSLQIDRIDRDILYPGSFNVTSPTKTELSVASRASTERMEGPRDYLISSRKARMEAEADLQVSRLSFSQSIR